MWGNCRRDKRNKTGLHCAEEIEQLIISHKRKHNEIAPPPTVLTLHPCSTHIYTKIIHTLLSFLSSSSGRDDHLILDKLSCSLSSSFTQNSPCLPHPSAALKESRKVKSVCEWRERGEKKEKKKKSGMFYFLNIIPEKPSFKKKKGGGGETGLGFKQHLTNIVALTSSIWLSPFSNCIIPLTHPMSQIQLQAAANKRQFDWNSNLRQAGQHMDHPVWCRAKISFSHHVWQLSLHKFLEANESLLVLVGVLVPNGTRAITVAAALKGVYTTPAIRQKCKLNSSPDSYSSYNNRDCWIRKIRKS